MRHFFELAKISAVALMYCATVFGQTAQSTHVPYCTMTNDPTHFLGKRIFVRAVYRYGFEVQRLDAPECCPGKNLKIWVQMGSLDAQSMRLFKKFPKGMGLALATFSGLFETGGAFGDGGYRYILAIDHIENLEATGHPSDSKRSPWTGLDCTSAENEKHTIQAHSPLHGSGSRRFTAASEAVQCAEAALWFDVPDQAGREEILCTYKHP